MNAYDIWKLNPPEPKESKCKCRRCENELYPGEEYYELEEEIYCYDCAWKWLKEQKHEVTGEMAYGF